jgi:hypothetical protein
LLSSPAGRPTKYRTAVASRRARLPARGLERFLALPDFWALVFTLAGPSVAAIDINSSRASGDAPPFLFKRHLPETLATLNQTSPAVVQPQIPPRDDVLVMLDSTLAVHPHEFGAQLRRELLFQRRPVRDQFDGHGNTPVGLSQE